MLSRVRPGTGADAAAIAEVHVASWQTTYAELFPVSVLAHISVSRRQQQWQQWLEEASPCRCLWVAESDGQIGGFIAGGPERTQHPYLAAEIYALYLRSDWQRQGIGRQLWRAATDDLHRKGLQGVRVWVWQENPAVSFYRSQGGGHEATRTVTIEGIAVPEWSFAWS